MSPPPELLLKNVLGVYNAMWEFGGQLVMDPKWGDHDNWLLTFRSGLRGMLARLFAFDREYVELRRYQANAPSDGNPNEWALHCESHSAQLLFAMDSAIECFVYAMNAIGFARDPTAFCDISDAKSLRKISIKNILGGDPTDKQNPRPGYQQFFPRVVTHWKAHESLLSTVCELHDVSKHRQAIVQGGGHLGLHVKDDPKNPLVLGSHPTHTVESIAQEFHEFIDELLPVALGEMATAFGYVATQTA